MTPKMIMALSDAQACVPYRGLERSVAGWLSTHPRAGFEHHSFLTVNALVNRGCLQLWHKNTIAHITDAGEAALERWREKNSVSVASRPSTTPTPGDQP